MRDIRINAIILEKRSHSAVDGLEVCVEPDETVF
jgi:hypothetical protein